MNHKRLAEYVAHNRKMRDWGLRQMAEICGISHATIIKIEAGKGYEPELATLHKIATAFANAPLRFGPKTAAEYMSQLLDAFGYTITPAPNDDARLALLRERLNTLPNGDELIEQLASAPPALQRQIVKVVASLLPAAPDGDPPLPDRQAPQTTRSNHNQTASTSPKRNGHHQRG